MKWFKHDSNAHGNAKLEKVLMKYGCEGYALYWYCLELIAGKVGRNNFTFELEHDAEILGYRLKIDSRRVGEIMLYMVNLGLFEISETTRKIVCMAMADRLDEHTAKNPEIKMALARFKESKTPDTLPTDSRLTRDQIRLDEIRLDKIKEKPVVAKNQTATEKSFSKNEKRLRELFPHVDFEIEKEKFLAFNSDKNLGADPYVKILAWFQRVPKPEEPKALQPVMDDERAAKLKKLREEWEA